ncbi:hypothetical protein [Citrobacter koseri]|uniref:hypothetical protein n=1 Tax=Citrobacter koseri TaxID=545 RepID=UPI0028BEDF03|nr:hypothetical protein [Citrobacter koseri]MDT7455753.1 hypothetical protein [Citrobacter koseri]MDT7503759.1 hypothetical protein [Citrobacter koseri]
MNAYLMYKDNDFIVDDNIPENIKFAMKDLELAVLFHALSDGDDFLYSVVRKACSVLLSGIPDIEYRQAILRDCLYNEDVIRTFYNVVALLNKSDFG